jgi:hypothetical protein
MTALAALAGCHEVTEYTDSGDFGAVILDASDLSVEGYVAGMEGARTLVSMGGSRFLVGTSTGMVHDVDSDQQAVLASHQVSSGASAALDCFIKSPVSSSIYMRAGSGKLLEMSTMNFDVLDEFTVGPSPSAMCGSPEGRGCIYVTDAEQGCLREVSASTNEVSWTYDIQPSPAAIAVHSATPPIMLTAHSDDKGLHAVRLDWSAPRDNWLLYSGTFADVASAPQDTVFCLAQPGWGNESGRLKVATVAWQRPFESRNFEVDGHPVCVCTNSDYSMPYFYAACADGDRTVVVMINYLTFEVEGTAEIDGYPWDISSHNNGTRLIVLTSL